MVAGAGLRGSVGAALSFPPSLRLARHAASFRAPGPPGLASQRRCLYGGGPKTCVRHDAAAYDAQPDAAGIRQRGQTHHPEHGMSLEIFTDGACRGNPGPGGWGALIRYAAGEQELSGAEPATTNNRMELTAAIMALREAPAGSSVDIYTDSKYVMDGLNDWMPAWKKRGWKTADKKPVKNQDLWQALDE